MQIVGYVAVPDGEGDGAALVLASDGDVERQSLAPGTELSFALGERHCAGRLTDRGHESCEDASAPHCELHASRWPCALCVGDCDLPIEACHDEHAIYLAAFAPDTFKVGVTRSWRLETRLREQGADRAAHLRTVANGRVAREIEAELATDLGDRVGVPEKVRGLDADVDEAAWRDLLADFEVERTLEFDYGLDLPERPVPETIAAGRVEGSKGRILVVERSGSRYAVDLRDLVGYEVTEGRPDRDLQSSLGAFD